MNSKFDGVYRHWLEIVYVGDPNGSVSFKDVEDEVVMRLIEQNPWQVATLGEVSALMARSPLYCQYPVMCLTEWIEPAIILNQIRVYRDGAGILIGYATWAFLAEDTERRLLNDPDVLLHLSEWNEGERLWIMDLLCVSGGVRDLIMDLRVRFAPQKTAMSMRRNEDGSIRKIVRWRRHKDGV